MPDAVYREATAKGYRFRQNGPSPYSKEHALQRMVMDGPIPDDTDDVLSTADLPSWKRMCMCILRNDYTCKTMGFAPTKDQQARINAVKDKYRMVVKGAKYE